MNVEVAQRLAELRRAKGYSQESLAHELGLSRQAVSKWERAESSPDTENLIALAKLYGVSLDGLLRVDDAVEDDIAFENASRAQDRAVRELEREHEEEQAAQAATEAAEERRRSQEATAQAVEAATQASAAAAQAAQAAAQASAQTTWTVGTAGAGHLVPAESKPHKGRWGSFPYGTCMTALFLILFFGCGSGKGAVLVFLTIPLYRWIARILDEAHERDDANPGTPSGASGTPLAAAPASPAHPCAPERPADTKEGR